MQNCIDALAAQSLADFEAIIVDNDSSDSSAEALRLPDGRFRLHLARANLGFAAANNFGAADCEAPWLATLNPDTVAGKTWLEELRSATLRHPGVKMFGSTQWMRGGPIAWTASATSIPSSARRGAGHRARPSARCPPMTARSSPHALLLPFTPATPIARGESVSALP